MADNENGVDYTGYYLKNYREKADDVIYLNSPEITDMRVVHGAEHKTAEPKAEYREYKAEQKAANIQTVPEQAARKFPEVDTKKPKKFTKKRKALLIFCIFLLSIGLTLLFADIISGGYVLSSIQEAIAGTNNTLGTYYAVEMTTFSDYNAAKIYAEELRAQGGAGYAINDGGVYRIIADVYDAEAEANSVIDKQTANGLSPKLHIISLPVSNLKNIPQKHRDAAKTALSYQQVVTEALQAVKADLASGAITENDAKVRLLQLKAKTDELKNNFETATAGEKNEHVINIKLEVIAAAAYVDNLLNDNLKRPNLISDIRYTIVMCLSTYRTLVNSLI